MFFFGPKKRPLNQPNEPRLFLLQPVVCSALSFCRSVKMCQTARLSHRTSNHTIPSLACLQSCLDCSNLQCALIKSIFVPFTCKRSLLFFFFHTCPVYIMKPTPEISTRLLKVKVISESITQGLKRCKTTSSFISRN